MDSSLNLFFHCSVDSTADFVDSIADSADSTADSVDSIADLETMYSAAG